jgi:hypothetical protein
MFHSLSLLGACHSCLDDTARSTSFAQSAGLGFLVIRWVSASPAQYPITKARGYGLWVILHQGGFLPEGVLHSCLSLFLSRRPSPSPSGPASRGIGCDRAFLQFNIHGILKLQAIGCCATSFALPCNLCSPEESDRDGVILRSARALRKKYS